MSPRRARALHDEGGAPDLRTHLIAVTERLLAEQGLEGLTTRRIARAANVADGVLYNHFANKSDLIFAGLVARASTLINEFLAACPTPGADTLEGNLTKFAAAMLNAQRGLLPLIAGMIGRRELLARFLAELHSPNIGGPEVILRALHDYLSAEQRLGRVSLGSDSHIVGVLLFAITQLQALAAHVRKVDATAATQELEPFVSFLTASLAAASTHARGPGPDQSHRRSEGVQQMTMHISLMLAVEDASEATDWYKRALGATELWSLGSVVGLRIEEAPFFLHEPTNTGFASPAARGSTTVRVEVFIDDPDSFVRRAVEAGADGSTDEVRDHQTPWGVHRQGGFRDPFGHVWLVGDKSPLDPFPRVSH